MNGLGRLLIVAGAVLAGLGVLVLVGLGRLPGDIILRRGNFTFYFPVVTCVLLSILLTLALALFRR